MESHPSTVRLPILDLRRVVEVIAQFVDHPHGKSLSTVEFVLDLSSSLEWALDGVDLLLEVLDLVARVGNHRLVLGYRVGMLFEASVDASDPFGGLGTGERGFLLFTSVSQGFLG